MSDNSQNAGETQNKIREGDPLQDYRLISNSAWRQYEAPDYKESDITGWKVQLSVDAEDLPKAWKLLAEQIPEYGIKVVKVATPSLAASFSDPKDEQSGKMIVIYDTDLDEWDKRLLAIEKLFETNGIRPGLTIKDNRPIDGSKYAFYIHDDGQELGGYRKAVSRRTFPKNQRHNIGGHPDPFKSIDVASVYGEISTPLERSIEQKVRSGQVKTSLDGATLFTGDIEGLQEMHNRFNDPDLKIRTKLAVTGPNKGFLRVMPASQERASEMVEKARAKVEQSGDSLPPISR